MNYHRLFILVCLLFSLSFARAETKTWAGGNNGDWATGANWSGGTAPANGDIVNLIGPVTVRLSSATALLSDFTLTNATVVVTNWNSHLQATNVTIRGGGKMTLSGPYSTNETPSRVSIICTNFTLEQGGVILVDTQGYRAAQGPGAGVLSRGQGGSYGGRGGWGDVSINKATWAPYGSVSAPSDPGSGGCVTNAGGTGGGAVWIEASGAATVNGTISANGGNGIYISAGAIYGSGGSGGSIYLQCGSLSGGTSGLIRVNGGAGSSNAGRGGGGRIAVAYAGAPAPWPAIRFNAAGGGSGYNPTVPFGAQWGTLWFPDAAAFGADLMSNVFADVQLVPGAVTSVTLPTFTVTTNTFRVGTSNFQLNVTGNLTVGTNANIGLWNVDVGGDLLLTNGGLLKVYANPTNGVSPDYGALLSVSNVLDIASNSWLYLICDEESGGGPLVRAGQLGIANKGGIDANAVGFRYTKGPGGGATGERTEGGGYGGASGRGSYGSSIDGLPYGSPTGPALCGSGGGGDTAGTHIGGFGGGLVRLEATGSVYVAGTISANGGSYMLGNSAGGSGGGVFIQCQSLSGATTGVIRANGGSSSGSGGRSGGGRICVNYSVASWPGPRFQTSPSYTGNASTQPYFGKLGSLYLSDFSALGEVVDANRFIDTVLFVSNQTSWQAGSLTVSNCALMFGEPAFQLLVTNALTVATNGSVSANRIYCDSLFLTNGGALTLQALPTNGTSNAEWGGLLAVTNDIIIGRSSWLYPVSDPTNGGSVLIAAHHVRVGDGGGVSAAARGFMGTKGPGGGSTASRRSGGGYGGRGGRSDNVTITETFGVTNGSPIAPLWPGSGGCLTGLGGYGGGVIRIEASGTVSLDGTLTALGGNGASSTASVGYPGAGAGGGIMVLCQELEGGATASIQAPGGNISTSGGGGGGRISVAVGLSDANRALLLDGQTPPNTTLYSAHAGFNGTLSAAPGTGYAHTNSIYLAQTGTYTFLSAGSFILTIKGDPATYGSPSPDPYGAVITIPSDSWVTNSVVTPADESNGLRRACLGWTLTLTNGAAVDAGTGSEAVFQFTNDMYLTWRWTNDWRFILTNGPNGSVNAGDYNPWYTNGTALSSITATPAGGYVFYRWVGDVPAGQETNNPIAVVMDQARTLDAAFRLPGGTTRTWNGSGRWQDHQSWSPAGMPGYEDAAILASGTNLITEPFACASLAVNGGAVLVFSNWNNGLQVGGDVLVASGGVVRIAAPYNDAGPSNRIWFSCANVTVESNGLIFADGLGYTWGNGPTHAGFGDSGRGAGGSHGGRGGYGSQTGCGPGGTYDTLAQPALGGGGGGNTLGGAGGGVIRIEASGTMQMQGTVSANGAVPASNCGGGAGGAIWISCASFGGSTSGLVRASGANTVTSSGGGGGGGRIAIHGALAGDPLVTFQTRAGTGGYADSFVEPSFFQYRAEPGTVYLTDSNWLTPDLTGGRFSDVTLYVSGMTAWAVDHLTVSNCSLTFGQPGFSITATNGVLLDGASAKLGLWNLTSLGDCVVTNGATLRVFATPTNGTLPEAGALVELGGALTVGPGSWVRPTSNPTNGGSVRFKVGSLAVATNAGVDASGKGYQGMAGPGYGRNGGSTYGGGGAYGGLGGTANYANATSGVIYGWAEVPELPGSGGGNNFAGWGGGLVWIESRGAATLDGTLAADGSKSWDVGGGGSGGGVLLACSRLVMTGTNAVITARGGSPTTLTGGGGGGGRVAVWLRLFDRQKEALLGNPAAAGTVGALMATNVYEGLEAQISVTNGNGYTPAYPGTVRFLVGQLTAGTIILIK